jgi:hypothetical protein
MIYIRYVPPAAELSSAGLIADDQDRLGRR